ncbi:MAG: hypothetical protein ACRC4L_00745 [Mycoplasma sp.]
MNINFEWDWRNILLLSAIIIAILIVAGMTIFSSKIKFFDERKKITFINSVAVTLGLIIGISISSTSGFKTFDELNTNGYWYSMMIYVMSSLTGFVLTALLLWFLFMLPLRFFSNLYYFTTYKKPLRSFFKISSFYFAFAFLAIGVSMLQYFMKDSFFAFDSAFSYDRIKINKDFHPSIYIAGRYILSHFVADANYTFYLIISCVSIMIIQIIFIMIMKNKNPTKLRKMINLSDKIANKSKIVSHISSVLIFTSITTSLLVQPLGTFIHIALVIMLMLLLLFLVVAFNALYSIIWNKVSFKEYKKIFLIGIGSSIKTSNFDALLNDVKSKHTYKGFENLPTKYNSYNIFATIIFPILIVGYLGFTSGPLLYESNLTMHTYFWITLLCLGYIFNFAYSFKSNNITASKLMLGMGAAYVVTGFNTGILNFFNPLINRIANLAAYSSYISFASYNLKKNKDN